MVRTVVSALVLVVVAACGDNGSGDSGADGSGGTDGLDCTSIALTSVLVTLEPAEGDVADSTVFAVGYSVDGGAFADCFNNPETLDFNCGIEETGSFVVRASGEGYLPAEATAEVGADECHVIPEAVTLVLEPAAR